MTTQLTFLEESLGIRFTLLNDFMQHVKFPNGTFVLRQVSFPDIESINWHAGYLVKKDGTIVCSEQANNYIAQFDGCKENEICF